MIATLEIEDITHTSPTNAAIRLARFMMSLPPSEIRILCKILASQGKTGQEVIPGLLANGQ